MKSETIKKQKYLPPAITCIQLDNEISLVLESDPPTGEGEAYNIFKEQYNNNPFKIETV